MTLVVEQSWDVPDAVVQRSGWLVDQVLEAPRTPGLVARHLDPASEHAGQTFDLLPRPEGAALGPADLLAAGLVAGPLPALAVRHLLDPAGVRRLAAALRPAPEAAELWSARPAALDAAEAARLLLLEAPGVTPLQATALLARTRPRLVPVLDDAAAEVLELPDGARWAALRAVLADPWRRDRVEALRPPGCDERVPTIRLLEVAAWCTAAAGRRGRTGIAR